MCIPCITKRYRTGQISQEIQLGLKSKCIYIQCFYKKLPVDAKIDGPPTGPLCGRRGVGNFKIPNGKVRLLTSLERSF